MSMIYTLTIWSTTLDFQKSSNFSTLLTVHLVLNLIGDDKLKQTLLGATELDQTKILKWFSLANSDLFTSMGLQYMTFVHRRPYNKVDIENLKAYVDAIAEEFEERLREFTFLATDDITIADIQAACTWTLAFNMLVNSEWKAKHPAIVRWHKTVTAEPVLKELIAKFPALDKPMEYVPPKKEKKEKKPQQQQQQPKKEAEKKPTEQPAQPKKEEHPLKALGPSTFVLDEWKRKYSNEETREVALPWFWEHYNPEEYSLWKVAYKYNDELTLTFMSNNLIGGFFNRLSASVKFMFGAMVVYGENNNNGIIGAMMIRGQDHTKAFDVAPDWESYDFVKLDPTKEEDKEFLNNMWAWDKPVVINGESKEIADGKVLK